MACVDQGAHAGCVVVGSISRRFPWRAMGTIDHAIAAQRLEVTRFKDNKMGLGTH